MRKSKTLGRSLGMLAATLLIAPLAAPAATASTQLAAVAAGLGCTRSGYGESSGEATCPASIGAFKVRVWCTWAGSGESYRWAIGWNYADCNRGSVSAIDIIT